VCITIFTRDAVLRSQKHYRTLLLNGVDNELYLEN
jgi:hypothetical protein